MATPPPPFTRTAAELQSLKHELQRLKVHLIAHLRSKGIPIVVPPPTTTTESHETGTNDEEGVCKTVAVETKIDNRKEEEEEEEEEAGTDSNEKSLLLVTGINTAVELLPRSLQSTISSSSSSHSKSISMSDQNDLAGNNSSKATSTPLLLHQHHDGDVPVSPQGPVRQGCCWCCDQHCQRWTQFMQYLSQCQFNIIFCRGCPIL